MAGQAVQERLVTAPPASGPVDEALSELVAVARLLFVEAHDGRKRPVHRGRLPGSRSLGPEGDHVRRRLTQPRRKLAEVGYVNVMPVLLSLREEAPEPPQVPCVALDGARGPQRREEPEVALEDLDGSEVGPDHRPALAAVAEKDAADAKAPLDRGDVRSAGHALNY
jgi:hypothetical protein